MLRTFVSLLLLSLFSGAPLYADNKSGYSHLFAPCISNAATTSAVSTCVSKELAFQDELLNTLYGEIIKIAPAVFKEKFRSVQRLWIDFRDSSCAPYRVFADKYGKSSSAVKLYESCLMDATMERNKYLKQFHELLKLQ